MRALGRLLPLLALPALLLAALPTRETAGVGIGVDVAPIESDTPTTVDPLAAPGREMAARGREVAATDRSGRVLTRRVGPEVDPGRLSALATRIDSTLSGLRWRKTRFALLMVDGETGDTLYARSPHEPMAPASNLKLLTTAAALHLLGPTFQWVTYLTTEAPTADGVVLGDVVLYGTGDPALGPGSSREPGAFDDMAAQLLARGIHRIEGRVLGDGTYFSGPVRLAEWDPRDLNDWFAAASPALAYNRNVVQIRVQPSTAGSAPIVHTDPASGGVEIDNQGSTSPSRPAATMHFLRDDPDQPIRIVGEVARGGRDVYRSMTVQDPVRFAAHGLTAALRAAGIEVTGTPGTVERRAQSTLSRSRIFAAGGPRVLARHRSAPLVDALAVVNLESHNLYADLVLKTLGRVVAGDGSYAGGARVIEGFATGELGLPEGAVHLLDGSGLAADNRVTAGALVAALRFTLESSSGEAFVEMLPEAGTRQLRRMERTPAARNLRAKTGTIEGVSALSGLVYSADGRPIVFAIVGNDLPSAFGAKRLEDAIGAALAAWTSAPSATGSPRP